MGGRWAVIWATLGHAEPLGGWDGGGGLAAPPPARPLPRVPARPRF